MTRAARCLGGIALALLLGAGAAAAEELPLWPYEQQSMLSEVEEKLLVVQRQLFKARQQHDAAAIETYGTRFRELQDTRRKLLALTRDQLPSE